MTSHDQMHVVFTHSAAIQERLMGFLKCIRKTCIHVVEPAFDLHLLASDELLWRTLHCAILKYLIQNTSLAQVDAVGCRGGHIVSHQFSSFYGV